MKYKIVKLGFDLFCATLLLLVLGIPMLVVACVIWVTMGSPIIFRQERPGIDGRLFHILKFRTMTSGRNCDDNLLPDSDRLTKVGQFLRSTSLDELPELINVLKGEMSLVGPRPLLIEYLSLYSSEQARRHEVLPGITGWAQVNGRNAISWEDKFKLDIWYVEHQSLWLDIKILWLTAFKVLRRQGISQDGQATMEKFRGSS